MTTRTEPAATEAEARVRRIHDAAVVLAAGLIQQNGCTPVEVASGLMSASMELFAAIGDKDTVRRLLHAVGDSLLD